MLVRIVTHVPGLLWHGWWRAILRIATVRVEVRVAGVGTTELRHVGRAARELL